MTHQSPRVHAILDHVGIAVRDLPAALAFYRDALGLDIDAPEEVASQGVRVYFIEAGQSSLELLEATDPNSPIAKFVAKHGPGLHHITLRVDDIRAALAQLAARGVRLVDQQPRTGAHGALVAFVHPSGAEGVLVELTQTASAQDAGPARLRPRVDRVTRYALGDLELISLCDGFFRLDGGVMFGAVPKRVWEQEAAADERNRITLAMRPLIVRGRRTMIIDAGLGDKTDEIFNEIYGVERARHLDHTLAEAGLAPEDIDLVLATSLHFDHAGGFTERDAQGRLKPRFPRAQYVVRRGEWEDAMHAHERSRACYLVDNYESLADAGVLQLVDDDQTIMPGVKVRRTGGPTMHHQIVLMESGGKAAAFVADLMPTPAHVAEGWNAGYDLYPMDTLEAKKTLLKEAVEREILVFFEHDPHIVAGYVRAQGDKYTVT